MAQINVGGEHPTLTPCIITSLVLLLPSSSVTKHLHHPTVPYFLSLPMLCSDFSLSLSPFVSFFRPPPPSSSLSLPPLRQPGAGLSCTPLGGFRLARQEHIKVQPFNGPTIRTVTTAPIHIPLTAVLKVFTSTFYFTFQYVKSILLSQADLFNILIFFL